MKRFLATCSLLLASVSAHALQMTLDFDMLNFSTHHNGSNSYRAPDFYIGNTGDEPLYNLFYGVAQFETDIFMFNYDDGEIGQLITDGNGGAPYLTPYEPNTPPGHEWTDPDTGRVYNIGSPTDVDGFLNKITDENGRTWDQYAVFVAPVDLLTVEMIQSYDFNIPGLRQYFNRRNSQAFYDETGLVRSSSYEFHLTVEDRPYPSDHIPYEHELNLNYWYDLNSSGGNNIPDRGYDVRVSEPATAGLLALAAFGLFYRRKAKA